MRVDLAGVRSDSDQKHSLCLSEALKEDLKQSYKNITVASVWRILESLEHHRLGEASR